MGNVSSATEQETTSDKAKKIVQDVQSSLKKSIRKFDESQSASFLDSLCGPVFDESPMKGSRSYAYSDDMSEEDSRTVSDGDNSTMESSRRGASSNRKGRSNESGSVVSQSDYESEATSRGPTPRKFTDSFESEDESYVRRKNKEIEKINTTSIQPQYASGMSKPLASAFAKRCYFTKAGIGKTTQHYEGLTLTGNVVLMLAAAMKLKGCPTICDEDLRRVEQTYPNQFSRLPDELLLSSGWRRISKYCHFSNKPLPDGVPFFHSKKRMHPSGGYYFLLAAAVGMIRPSDVEPLTRDTLVLLETDYPSQADAAPPSLLQDPTEWTLVDKFCFFSGGPINTEEDVYYKADFDGNPIHMLAFLSPSLTPDELYKLTNDNTDEPGLKSVAAVEEVESVYDLTDRDFDDLKLYHLGPCRALPPYMLQPHAWTKVLPPHFLTAKHRALLRAQRWEEIHGPCMSMCSSAVASTNEYNHGPPMNPLAVQVGAPPMLSPAAAGLPLGTPQSPGMISPGMIPASPAFYESQDDSRLGVPVDQGYTEVHRKNEPFETPLLDVPAPNGYGYYNFTPPSPPAPREIISSETESEQPTFMGEESFQREVEEEGAFIDKTLPIDEAIALRSQKLKDRPNSSVRGSVSPPGYRPADAPGMHSKRDPPEDEPPSLSRSDIPDDEDDQPPSPTSYYTSPSHTVDESSPIGYYHSGAEFSHEKNSHDGDSGYYSKEDEYYDSPEQRGTNPFPPPNDDNYYRQDEGAILPESENPPESYGGDVHYQSQTHYHENSELPRDYHHGDDDYNHPVGHDEYHHDPHDYGHPDDYPRGPHDFGHPDDHPDYHHGVPPDYHDHGPPHPGYNDGGYHGGSQASYSDDGNSGYHDAAHTGAFPSADEVGYRGEPHSPDSRYQGRDNAIGDVGIGGPVEYYRSPEGDEACYNNTENEPPLTDRFAPVSLPSRRVNMPSPKSEVSRGSGASDPSQTSSAMRTAQDLLRRNRAKRLDADRMKQNQEQVGPPDDEQSVGNGWSESGSEITSVISGSSVWTDTSNTNDRSSRRALILQMAKARMKQNKSAHAEDKTNAPIAEEGDSFKRIGTSMDAPGIASAGSDAGAANEYVEDLELD